MAHKFLSPCTRSVYTYLHVSDIVDVEVLFQYHYQPLSVELHCQNDVRIAVGANLRVFLFDGNVCEGNNVSMLQPLRCGASLVLLVTQLVCGVKVSRVWSSLSELHKNLYACKHKICVSSKPCEIYHFNTPLVISTPRTHTHTDLEMAGSEFPGMGQFHNCHQTAGEQPLYDTHLATLWKGGGGGEM